MKEKTTKFELTETTKAAILSASKGAYTAQALAVIEGYRAKATFKQVANAIRACVKDGKGWTASNAAILAGMQSARVQTVNGVKLTDTEYQAQVALGMEAGAKRHSDEVAKSRADAKAEKAEAEAKAAEAAAAEAAAAATRKASDLLRAKVADLEAWINDANIKLSAARGELEKALVEEANETARNMDQLTAFYTSAGLPIPANLAALIDTPEIQADLALARKHAEFLAGVALARANQARATEAETAAAAAVAAPIPEKDEVSSMLAERAADMNAAITAQSVARHARKADKKVA